MSQVLQAPFNTIPKFTGDPLRRDWNDFQHLATQGRYIRPKVVDGSRVPLMKLASVKKQLYHPLLPTFRHMERDEVLCRLPEENCRHTTFLSEEDFEKSDPARPVSQIDFVGMNWHDTGKTLMGSTESLDIQAESTPTFGLRLRENKSIVDRAATANRIYRSPSLSALSPAASLTEPIRYSYRNFGYGTYDQTAKSTMWPRLHMNTKNSFDSINRMPLPSNMQGIFRSTSMRNNVSTAPWKPSGTIASKLSSKKTST